MSRQFINVGMLALAFGCAVGALFIMVRLCAPTFIITFIDQRTTTDSPNPCILGAQLLVEILQVSSGTLVARAQASRALATLPVGLVGITAMLSAIPAQLLSRKHGKRVTFMTASALGVAGAALTCAAVKIDSFGLLCASAVPQGMAYGVANLYRFAAVEFAGDAHKERALAATVGGAVLSAFIGPEASRHVRDQLSTPLLGAFVLELGLFCLQFALISSIDYSATADSGADMKGKDAAANPPRMSINNAVFDGGSEHCSGADGEVTRVSVHVGESGDANGKRVEGAPPAGDAGTRRWYEIVNARDYYVAAAVAAMTFFGMGGLMAATPLAMADEGYDADASTLVIEAHLVAMYVPSFFTGQLLRRVGVRVMMGLGSSLLVGGTLFYYVDPHKWVFWVAMILIGSGWNFNYVAASNLVTTTYQPHERFVGQGIFDMIALTGQSAALASASFTFDGIGWDRMYNVRRPIALLNAARSDERLSNCLRLAEPPVYWSMLCAAGWCLRLIALNTFSLSPHRAASNVTI